MANFLERVKSESEDLGLKIKALYQFTKTEIYAGLSEREQMLLRFQLDDMHRYQHTLWLRIEFYKFRDSEVV